jgi:hypothetical protein
MKYTVYAITEGRVRMYCYAPTNDKEWQNEEKVAEARTVKEAQKIIRGLGEIELI